MEDSQFQTHAFRHSEEVVYKGKLYPLAGVDFERSLIAVVPTYTEDDYPIWHGYIWIGYQDVELQPYRSAYPSRSVRKELIK
ncbi:MAG: hypothetical protein ABI002_14605 [Saprospiraceae bacterium]